MVVGNLDTKWVPDDVVASAGADSAVIVIPGWVNGVTATAIPGGGGSAIVYHTTDETTLVESDPAGREWTAWDAGSVTTKKSQATRGPITGLKIAAVGASARLKVAGERRAR